MTSPDRFATHFNTIVPGAYRQITAQDIRDMVECGLIKHYGYYLRSDLETVRAVLRYEQLREKRIQKSGDRSEPSRCKMCREPLPPQSEDKKGRPKEHCQQCQHSRSRERYRKWRRKQKVVLS